LGHLLNQLAIGDIPFCWKQRNSGTYLFTKKRPRFLGTQQYHLICSLYDWCYHSTSRTINWWGGILNHLSMAYLLTNICTKNYWNRTTTVEITVGGWVVSFFETQTKRVPTRVTKCIVFIQKSYLNLLLHYSWQW